MSVSVAREAVEAVSQQSLPAGKAAGESWHMEAIDRQSRQKTCSSTSWEDKMAIRETDGGHGRRQTWFRKQLRTERVFLELHLDLLNAFGVVLHLYF